MGQELGVVGEVSYGAIDDCMGANMKDVCNRFVPEDSSNRSWEIYKGDSYAYTGSPHVGTEYLARVADEYGDWDYDSAKVGRAVRGAAFQIWNLESSNPIAQYIREHTCDGVEVPLKTGGNARFWILPESVKRAGLPAELQGRCVVVRSDGRLIVPFPESVRDENGRIIEVAYASSGYNNRPDWQEREPRIMAGFRRKAEEIAGFLRGVGLGERGSLRDGMRGEELRGESTGRTDIEEVTEEQLLADMAGKTGIEQLQATVRWRIWRDKKYPRAKTAEERAREQLMRDF